jgi:hypothetical protein
MKTKERKEAARKRIKELQELIRDWDLAELDKQISAGDMGRTDYDPDNMDNVRYFSQEEMACISFHILELQDGVIIDRAVPENLIIKMLNVLEDWQKKQLSQEYYQ